MELLSVVAFTFARQPEGHGPDHAIARSGHRDANEWTVTGLLDCEKTLNSRNVRIPTSDLAQYVDSAASTGENL